MSKVDQNLNADAIHAVMTTSNFFHYFSAMRVVGSVRELRSGTRSIVEKRPVAHATSFALPSHRKREPRSFGVLYKT